MKILIHAINFWPELTGCGKYTGEMAQWLADQGHEVSVVTAPPYYPEWRVAEGHAAYRYARSTMPSASGAQVRILRCPLWVPAKVSGLSRLIHLMTFAASSLPALAAAMLRGADLVILVAPTAACAPAVLLLSRMLGVPSWIHVQDFEVDAAFELGVVSGSRMKRWALWLEGALLRRFSRASSITPRMVERLMAKGVRPEQALLFPNWVDLDAVHPLSGENAFRSEWGIKADDIVLLYSGNMGEKQGLELLVDAAQALQGESRFRFVLAGDGAARSRLEAQAAGLSNILWLPLQPVDKLNLLLNAADIHLLPQRGDAADLVMPSKLTGMLASGRAVLGTAKQGTQLGEVLAEVGARTEPGDLEEFVAQIRALGNDASLRAHLGRRGRHFAQENMGKERIMARFLAAAEALCGLSVTPTAAAPRV